MKSERHLCFESFDIRCHCAVLFCAANIAGFLRFAAVSDHDLRVLKSGAILSKMHCAATKIAWGCYSALAGLALGHVGDVALCLGRVLLRDGVSC